MKAAGKLVAPVADWPTKRGWVDYAFGEFEKAGYTVASAYTVVKDKSKTKFLYRDMLWSGADLMGLGVASFSHVGGTHFQNLDGFAPYIEACEAGKLPINRAYTPTPQERFIREFILQLKLGRASIAYFREKFGRDVETEFAAPFKTLCDWGYLSIANGNVLLNRAGLLRVDRLLHEFFLPEHRHVRYT
jgi:oxygen-independent coproporphyrinogen-3 oxidase